MKTKAASWFLLFHGFIVDTVISHPFFAERIPNGKAVPNPGPQGGVWAGVGHVNAAGGGPRNPFGLDFADQGFEWTVELCEMDSDQDGRSNGEELGDPFCEWTPGQEPSGPALSHPGIVDDVKEEPADEPCSSYEAPPDVQLLNVTFSTANEMDETRTHYRCEQMMVDDPLASVRSYHQIKTEVLLDNVDILHHMWIYLCDNVDSTDGNRVGQGPYSCSGMEGNCQIVAGWAVGAKDWCEPPNVGASIDFGRQGRITVKIEAHYDNSLGTPQTDQSGMRLSITPTLRPLDSGFVVLGMDYWDREFTIPGGAANFEIANICPTSATMYLDHPVYVYAWNPHMHLYGKQLVTEHYLCGEKIGELGRIEDFEFDNQQSYHFKKPIKILPGDALVTTCSFDTTNVAQGSTIVGGEETTEEMCDNYLTYYPWAGTNNAPTLFTACSSFNTGANPDIVGYDDFSPFATLDLGGDLFVNDYEIDPELNIAPCCASDSCESIHLATQGQPCGSNDDCNEGLVCEGGLCDVESPQVPTPSPVAPSQAPDAPSNLPVAPTPSTVAPTRVVETPQVPTPSPVAPSAAPDAASSAPVAPTPTPAPVELTPAPVSLTPASLAPTSVETSAGIMACPLAWFCTLLLLAL